MTISAKIIADSINKHSPRITTLQLRYPKFIHGELMTHRVFSRNASSSRAIPVERLIKDVIEDPVYPMHWGKNQPGMSAREEHNFRVGIGGKSGTREEMWDRARNDAIYYARAFTEAGYHKQIVNRLIEPFCHINVVVTSTEWSNFFALRCHPDAQPEMRILAEWMREAMYASTPRQLLSGQWHLPYVTDNELWVNDYSDDPISYHTKLSVARCARVSYLTQEGKTPTIEEDLKLYDRLVSAVPLHASPAEHQATPDHWYEAKTHLPGAWEKPHLHGNLRGWVQYRKTLLGENQ